MSQFINSSSALWAYAVVLIKGNNWMLFLYKANRLSQEMNNVFIVFR